MVNKCKYPDITENPKKDKNLVEIRKEKEMNDYHHMCMEDSILLQAI